MLFLLDPALCCLVWPPSPRHRPPPSRQQLWLLQPPLWRRPQPRPQQQLELAAAVRQQLRPSASQPLLVYVPPQRLLLRFPQPLPLSEPGHQARLSWRPIGPLPPCSPPKPEQLRQLASPSTRPPLSDSPHPAPCRRRSTSSWLPLLRLSPQGFSPPPFSPTLPFAPPLPPHTLARHGQPQAAPTRPRASTLPPAPAVPGGPAALRPPSTSVPAPSPLRVSSSAQRRDVPWLLARPLLRAPVQHVLAHQQHGVSSWPPPGQWLHSLERQRPSPLAQRFHPGRFSDCSMWIRIGSTQIYLAMTAFAMRHRSQT
mmetsp:Transcript_19294/g.51542  ORF Transcript_19294/g.51542 Transcript_19294/m.51542 type:complete len:312 (-) Transcript_19294:95-1030(-)